MPALNSEASGRGSYWTTTINTAPCGLAFTSSHCGDSAGDRAETVGLDPLDIWMIAGPCRTQCPQDFAQLENPRKAVQRCDPHLPW